MGNFRGKPLIVMLFTALKVNAQVPIQRPRQQSVPNQMSADTTLRFDVLSVKLTVPSANPLEHRQIRNTDPGRVHYVNVGLKDIMMNAYSLKEYQVVGPDWLNMIAVDIDATMRAGTPKEQLRVMFQNLLADRFKLTFHWATKKLPVYSILVVRSGPKMRESADLPSSGNSVPPPPVEGPLKLDTDGFPISAGSQRDGIQTTMINGRSQLRGRRSTMQDLENELSKTQLTLPVTAQPHRKRLVGKRSCQIGQQLGAGPIQNAISVNAGLLPQSLHDVTLRWPKRQCVTC